MSPDKDFISLKGELVRDGLGLSVDRAAFSHGAPGTDAHIVQGGRAIVIILGVILLIIGFIAAIHILWILGIILLVVGVVLALLGGTSRAVGGRRHYF
jgi:hypothetical protein